jgi:hypothetical protein
MNFQQIAARAIQDNLQIPHPLQLQNHQPTPGAHARIDIITNLYPIPLSCLTIEFYDNHITATHLRAIERKPKTTKPGHQPHTLYYEDPQLCEQLDQMIQIALDIHHELQQPHNTRQPNHNPPNHHLQHHPGASTIL